MIKSKTIWCPIVQSAHLSNDFHLDPITLILNLDLNMVKIYQKWSFKAFKSYSRNRHTDSMKTLPSRILERQKYIFWKSRWRHHGVRTCFRTPCFLAQYGPIWATPKQYIEKFTQFLQFTLWCAHIIYEYSARLDLWIMGVFLWIENYRPGEDK